MGVLAAITHLAPCWAHPPIAGDGCPAAPKGVEPLGERNPPLLLGPFLLPMIDLLPLFHLCIVKTPPVLLFCLIRRGLRHHSRCVVGVLAASANLAPGWAYPPFAGDGCPAGAKLGGDTLGFGVLPVECGILPTVPRWLQLLAPLRLLVCCPRHLHICGDPSLRLMLLHPLLRRHCWGLRHARPCAVGVLTASAHLAPCWAHPPFTCDGCSAGSEGVIERVLAITTGHNFPFPCRASQVVTMKGLALSVDLRVSFFDRLLIVVDKLAVEAVGSTYEKLKFTQGKSPDVKYFI